jgi:hypothetical protein
MKADALPEYLEAITFLEGLRAPPWAITAIAPDTGKIETISAKDARDARRFLQKYGGERNIYYSVNPTKAALNKKAKKEDIAAVEYIHADLDPVDGESPAEAKQRYLRALQNFQPQPCSVVDSGNGIQALWPLKQPILLDSQAVTENIEELMKALMQRLGSVAGTQNVDRIMRLPGTTNFPNAKKLKKGYVVCPTRQINLVPVPARALVEPSVFPLPQKVEAPAPRQKQEIRETSIDWSLVAQHEGWLKSVDDVPADFHTKGKIILGHVGNLPDLCDELRRGGHIQRNYSSWSDVTLALAGIFKADGRFASEQIAAALMCPLKCNEHVTKKTGTEQRRAVERALIRSHGQGAASALPWRERTRSGLPRPSMHNARLAITALGIECRQDTFHNRTLVGYSGDAIQHELQSVVGEVTDDAILRLRQILSDHYGVDFCESPVRDAVRSLAQEHRFDPVCDLLDKAEAEWDRKERLDRMAVDYFNAKDTELNRAIVRKTMIALVRRARVPGCKFDTITVLESPEGWEKSGAWRAIAGDENFSDQSILGRNGREVQEQLADVWLHESADLAGLGKAEVETVKAFASRQVDIARPAYGRTVVRQPRHSICVGTTNDDEYLQSQTGNRRFWPIKVDKRIDLEKLRADRLQLLGEAAHYESQGESITLDERLWGAARQEQERRRVKDDWEDLLARMPRSVQIPGGHGSMKWVDIIHSDAEFEYVATNDILTYVLDRPVGRRENHHSIRLARVMRHVGDWKRTSHGKVTIGGKQVRGYYRRRDGTLPLANTTPAEEPGGGG